MKTLSQVYLVIAGFFLVYFLYQAVTTVPSEGDSLAYHLPIAHNILANKWTNFENQNDLVNSLLQYYPASSHVILALFVALHIPQLFNFVGWCLLGVCTYFLAMQSKVSRDTAVIYAITVISLTALVRLLLTQTIDIWLAVWFVLSVLTILRYQSTPKAALLLGFSLGMLIGTKFTGPLFALVLCAVFIQELWKRSNLKQGAIIAGTILIVGLSWYLKNFITHGDFFYPSSHPLFHLDEWYTWQTITASPANAFYFVQALISEYSFWSLSLLLLPIVCVSPRSTSFMKRLSVISILCFIIHLALPAAAVNVLSDLRYAAPTFITAILVMFMYAEKIGKAYALSIASLIQVVLVFSLKMSHQPKIFVGYALLLLVGFWFEKEMKAFIKNIV